MPTRFGSQKRACVPHAFAFANVSKGNTVSPCSSSTAVTAAAWSALTTNTMPMPAVEGLQHFRLGHPALLRQPAENARQIPCVQDRRPRPTLRQTRGRFSVKPPPVIWAKPCTPPARSLQGLLSHKGVWASAAPRPTCPRPMGTAHPSQARFARPACAPVNSRWNAPRQTPSPNRTSPAATPRAIHAPLHRAHANPPRSKSPCGYMPGISAVSPPINAQPDNSHPRQSLRQCAQLVRVPACRWRNSPERTEAQHPDTPDR